MMKMNKEINKEVIRKIIQEGYKLVRKQNANELTRSQAIGELVNKMEDLIRNDIKEHKND